MRHFRLAPIAAAAFVAVYAATVFLPWYFLSTDHPFARVSSSELILQGLYQGVLVGFVSFIALNRAIAALGCMKASAFISAVPVLTAVIAIPVLGEQPPFADCAALLLITLGAVLASRVPHDAATPPPPSVYEHGPTRLTRATRTISGASTG